jgi:hypothetical protein
MLGGYEEFNGLNKLIFAIKNLNKLSEYKIFLLFVAQEEQSYPFLNGLLEDLAKANFLSIYNLISYH